MEYTSAVLPDNNMVCEVVFEKCDEQFIYNTLANYEYNEIYSMKKEVLKIWIYSHLEY